MVAAYVLRARWWRNAGKAGRGVCQKNAPHGGGDVSLQWEAAVARSACAASRRLQLNGSL